MTKRVLLNFFLIVLIALGIACAPKGKKPQRPKPPSQQAPVGVEGQIEGEEESPEREASNALIEQGEVSFQRGLYDQAAGTFQEAVTVDATNGAAYYWLARTKLRSGEYGEAEGLIEKSLTLLSHRPEWAERLEELQREFHQNKPDE